MASIFDNIEETQNIKPQPNTKKNNPFVENIDNQNNFNIKNYNTDEMFSKIKNFFKKETGEGDLDIYLNHPLNIKQTKGMCHILRGLSGLFGNLKNAIFDIVIGILKEFYKNKKT